MKLDVLPEPKEIARGRGTLRLPRDAAVVAAGEARAPARVLAERLGLRTAARGAAGRPRILMRVAEDMDFARGLDADRRAEAHRVEITPGGVEIAAPTAEGLLRGAATLLQTARRDDRSVAFPCATIRDWPDVRYRCASDWLLNAEVNRWSYDWGDGPAAFLARTKRKLDFCFAHKINMVWFDGFGWNTRRFPGYAALMRACTTHARRLGIRLVFAGYGGGYGTAYQRGEIYRYGYFGDVRRNRRPWPDGAEYDCCGLPSHEGSRRYGTCPSNRGLASDKLDEMKRFVAAVRPGFMYIHDIDAGSWLAAEEAWKHRCPACRRRWPSDRMADPKGQAGAYGAWFARVRRELGALPPSGDYSPARDLTLIFTSPLYTHCDEKAPPGVWEMETEYFETLSRCVGPARGVEFGFREQFLDERGRPKIALLRERLDRVGKGHGIHVIAFCGGDNYLSDDPANISGTLARLYRGAESVCLSTGGLHEEPVQMLNADCLWSGSAGGRRETPRTDREAAAILREIAAGTRRPREIFDAGGYFSRLCARLWGREAGRAMARALTVRAGGRAPVGHVWWTITKAVAALAGNTDPARTWEKEIREYADRERATAAALRHARRAACLSDSEDIRRFVRCLEIGERFAEAVRLLLLQNSRGTRTGADRLRALLASLERSIRRLPDRRTDILGGDPGCWMETLATMRDLSRARRRPAARRIRGGTP